MALSDSIFSIIILIIISFTSIFILSQFYFNSVINEYEQFTSEKEYDIQVDKLETLLLLEDPYSQNSFFEDSLLFLSNQSYLNSSSNIYLWYKDQLDYLYGEDNYYFKMYHDIEEFNLVFIYDAGEFMSNIDNKENFSQIIYGIHDSLENEEDIEFTIKTYIISIDSSDEQTYCNEKYRNNDRDIDCEIIPFNTIYDETKIFNPYKAETNNSESYSKSIGDRLKTYSQNDWASITKKILQEDYVGTSSFYTKKLQLFLFSDVINLGSPPQSVLISNNEEDGGWTAMANQVCSKFDNYNYSNYSVNELVEFINTEFSTMGYYPIIFWDEQTPLLFEEYMTHDYIRGIMGFTVSKSDNYCNDPNCPGCQAIGNDFAIYHENTRDVHLQQLERVVNATEDGEITIYDKNNFNLSGTIQDQVDSILESAQFTIGDKRNTTRKIAIQNNNNLNIKNDFVTFKFYVEIYEDNYKYNQTLSIN